MEDPAVLYRFLKRERLARKEAEQLLEVKSVELDEARAAISAKAKAHDDQLRRTQAIIEAATEAIIVTDALGNIDTFNAAAQRLFGCDAQAAIGNSIAKFVPSVRIDAMPPDEETLVAQVPHVYLHSDGAPLSSGTAQGRRLDGTPIRLELTLQSFCDGAQQFYTLVVHDLARGKQSELQLAHAQKMESVGQLAAGIAHEINTPIQYVGDNLRFLHTSFDEVLRLLSGYKALLSEVKADEGTQELIENIVECEQTIDLPFLVEEIPLALSQSLAGVESVAKIVRAMKDFSHPGLEEKQTINLNDAIESTLTVSRNLWKYCAELVTDFDPSLTAVACLPCDLNQAVLNLITNAVHAMEEAGCGKGTRRGTLTVITRREEDYAAVEVCDTGTGISPAIRSRIFDPFFTTKSIGQGTGQGLPIAYNIVVEKHQGELTFESIVGIGTKFRFRIPLAAKTAETPVGVALGGSPANLGAAHSHA